MKDIMIDLEFMDTSPTSAITAIGAVEFNPFTTEIGRTFYTTVDLQTSVLLGGTMSAATVLWWMKQSDEARKEFEDQAPHINLALTKLTAWLHEREHRDDIKIWGNGAASDNVILRGAYERSQLPTPWSFRNDRCYRTLRALAPEVKFESVGVAHNALDDAKGQAMHLNKVFMALGLSNS